MALDQGSKAVPGIPLGALDAITDANVRDVLRALVSTHHVRNNQAGTGAESFITIRQGLQLTATSTGTAGAAAALPARYMRGSGDGSVYGAGSAMSGAVGTTSLTLAAPARLAATVIWRALPSDMPNTGFALRCDGADVLAADNSAQFHDTINALGGMSFIASGAFAVDAGSHAITLHFNNSWHAGSYTVDTWAVLLLPVGS